MDKPTAIVNVLHTQEAIVYEYEDIKTGKKVNQPEVSAIEYSVALESLKSLSGKMLTFIEASTLDKEQRKASKDIVKGFFSEEMTRLADICFSRELTTRLAQDVEVPEELEGKTVDLEDVIYNRV